MTDAAIAKTFGPEIKPFLWNEETPGFTDVESTLWDGETLAPFVVYGIGVHLEVGEQALTAKGNSFLNTVTDVFPSPDAITILDASTAFVNGAGVTTDLSLKMLPAVMRYGSAWQALMMWHFVRSFRYQWKVANQVSIIDNLLRTMAYTPSDASGSAASSSELDVNDIVREMNDYYATIGSNAHFSKIDTIRLGSLPAGGGTTGPTVAGSGSFSPSRAEELVGVTYGSYGVGAALTRDLKNNSEYMKLDCPYVLGSGKQLGIQLHEVDEVQAEAFRKQLSASNSVSGSPVPAITSDTGGLTPGGFWEQFLDGSGGKNQSNYPARAVYKAGSFKMTFRLLGQEVSEDTYATITDPDVRAALTQACNVQFPGFKP
jgi:hypothetical protein